MQKRNSHIFFVSRTSCSKSTLYILVNFNLISFRPTSAHLPRWFLCGERCVYINITLLTIASSVLSPRQWCEVPCAHFRGRVERCAHPGRGRPEPARPPAVRSLAAASQQHQQLRGRTHRACQQISPGRSCREGRAF